MFIKPSIKFITRNNKRAQRALGRSPEEIVKGQSGANLENPRGIIWTTLVEDLWMMIYTKYESSGPFSLVLDKKIFENCMLKNYFLTSWPTHATSWNGLNNFDRGSPMDHSCEVWSNSNKRF